MQDNLHASLIDQTGMIHALNTLVKLFTFRFHFCLKYTNEDFLSFTQEHIYKNSTTEYNATET